jgi:hypothetical protein
MDTGDIAIYSIERSNREFAQVEVKSESSADTLPPFPRRTLSAAYGLLILGTVLILAGFIDRSRNPDDSMATVLWIVGGLLATPALFFTLKLAQAWKTEDTAERHQILREIPEI